MFELGPLSSSSLFCRVSFLGLLGFALVLAKDISTLTEALVSSELQECDASVHHILGQAAFDHLIKLSLYDIDLEALLSELLNLMSAGPERIV